MSTSSVNIHHTPFPNTTMNPAPKVRAPAVPIETLHTDAAKLYTHIHPVLVLSLYALRFNAIVADPVPALLRTLVPLAALQIAYVAICLPPTGSGTVMVEKKKPGEKKKVAERGLSRSIIVRLPCP
jgi:phosphatidylinositol glycan class F